MPPHVLPERRRLTEAEPAHVADERPMAGMTLDVAQNLLLAREAPRGIVVPVAARPEA
jgi:hypothetical protein